MNPGTAIVTLDDVIADDQVRVYVERANDNLRALGYTEHGIRHVGLVASIVRNVLGRLGYPRRVAELGSIAGYLHDIGNVVHRENHALTGAQISQGILLRLGMGWEEVAEVIHAIGNHEEERGNPTSAVSAALVLADKSDVHRSRVQESNLARFDIHDRVNHAARRSFVRVSDDRKVIGLELEIDTTISSVLEYFEIFLSRMVMCRKAAQHLGCVFALTVNGHRLS